MKSKYSIDEQLKNLEDKNVQFNIMSKEEAREYLQNNTYYFKLKNLMRNHLNTTCQRINILILNLHIW